MAVLHSSQPNPQRKQQKKENVYAIKQIKICAEYRDMLPRPRLDLSGTPGLRPIGLSPGSWQTSLGLGSMSQYSAQILICIWSCSNKIHHRCECAFSFTWYYLNKKCIWNVFLVFNNVNYCIRIQTHRGLSLSRSRQTYDQCSFVSCCHVVFKDDKKSLEITRKLYELHYMIDNKNMRFFVVENLKYDGNTSPPKIVWRLCITLTVFHHPVWRIWITGDLYPS